MKQKDIATIVLVSGLAAVFAFVIGNVVLGGTDRRTDVETVQAINSNFPLPDDRFFNELSLNPTKTIQIGDTTNPDPFADGTVPAEVTQPQ